MRTTFVLLAISERVHRRVHRLSIAANFVRLLRLTARVSATVLCASTVVQAQVDTATATPTVTATPVATAWVINSTGDDDDAAPGNGICETGSGNGVCTLRAAIEEAAAYNGGTGDTLTFDIDSSTDTGCNSGTHICTTTPATCLPDLPARLTIDGLTQTGATAGAYWTGSPPVLKIALDNRTPTCDEVFNLPNGYDTVRGLSIRVGTNTGHGFTLGTGYNKIKSSEVWDANGAGIAVSASSSFDLIGGPTLNDGNWLHDNGDGGVITGDAVGTQIAFNVVGTSADGMSAASNGGDGIEVKGGVGIAVLHNQVSSNTGHGIIANESSMTGQPARQTVIADNYAGLDRTGAATLCNSYYDIQDIATDSILSNNSTCPPLVACCGFSGANDFGATCLDSTALTKPPAPTQSSDCDSIASTIHEAGAVTYNGTSYCIPQSEPGDHFDGVCPTQAPTATPTATP
jgi:CSLREA domain-containing protein